MTCRSRSIAAIGSPPGGAKHVYPGSCSYRGEVGIKKEDVGVKLELLIPLIVLGFVVSSTAAFLAELLESGIGAQRIPVRVKPKKGRRNRALQANQAKIWRL